MTDWLFRITSVAALATDLDAFCTQYGYPSLTIDDGAGGRTVNNTAFSPHIRFDFDFHRIVVNTGTDTSPVIVDRGLHANVRGMALNVPNASLALTQLDANLKAYFSAKPTITNTATAPLTGGQVWRTTGATILIDPVPTKQKRVWA